MATTEALSMLAGRGEGRPWTREAAHPGRVRMRITSARGFYSRPPSALRARNPAHTHIYFSLLTISGAPPMKGPACCSARRRGVAPKPMALDEQIPPGKLPHEEAKLQEALKMKVKERTLTVFEREMRKLLDEKREALKIERNEARTRRAQKTESITLLSAIERAMSRCVQEPANVCCSLPCATRSRTALVEVRHSSLTPRLTTLPQRRCVPCLVRPALPPHQTLAH